MHDLTFAVMDDGAATPQTISIEQAVIAGWTGRDPVARDKHIAELEAIARERSFSWYRRAQAMNVYEEMAKADPEARATLAVLLREVLESIILRSDNLDEDESTLAASVVSALAELRDPQMRPLIDRAFETDVVDRSFITPEDVDRKWQREPSCAVEQQVSFMENYRAEYERHLEDERQALARADERARMARQMPVSPAVASPAENATASRERSAANSGHPVRAPVTSSKVGRNEPCPCRSGKKYKKCCGRG